MQDVSRMCRLSCAFLLAALLVLAGCTNSPGANKQVNDLQQQVRDLQATVAALQTAKQAPTSPPAAPSTVAAALPPSVAPVAPASQAPTQAAPAATVPQRSAPADSCPNDVAGRWRVFSERIFYDQGGAGDTSTRGGRDLSLNSNCTWDDGGPTSGTWSVSGIPPSDWQRWQVSPYGPTRKITLNGWSGGIAEGPVEDDHGTVDFIWAIFHVAPPLVAAPGLVEVRYSRR